MQHINKLQQVYLRQLLESCRSAAEVCQSVQTPSIPPLQRLKCANQCEPLAPSPPKLQRLLLALAGGGLLLQTDACQQQVASLLELLQHGSCPGTGVQASKQSRSMLQDCQRCMLLSVMSMLPRTAGAAAHGSIPAPMEPLAPLLLLHWSDRAPLAHCVEQLLPNDSCKAAVV